MATVSGSYSGYVHRLYSRKPRKRASRVKLPERVAQIVKTPRCSIDLPHGQGKLNFENGLRISGHFKKGITVGETSLDMRVKGVSLNGVINGIVTLDGDNYFVNKMKVICKVDNLLGHKIEYVQNKKQFLVVALNSTKPGHFWLISLKYPNKVISECLKYERIRIIE